MAISTIPTLEAIRETLIPMGYDIIPITHLRDMLKANKSHATTGRKLVR